MGETALDNINVTPFSEMEYLAGAVRSFRPDFGGPESFLGMNERKDVSPSEVVAVVWGDTSGDMTGVSIGFGLAIGM